MNGPTVTALLDTAFFLLALLVPVVLGLLAWEGVAALLARRRQRRALPPPSAACRRGLSGTDYYRVSKTPRSL